MRMSEQINELAAALAKAQAEFKPVEKNCENPHYKSSFADLTAMKTEAQPKLAKHGLAVIQPPSTRENGDIVVTTILMHTSGQFIEESLTLRPTKADPQGAGSAITYGERYSYKSMVGLTVRGEDDDGNDASNIKPGMPAQRGVGQSDFERDFQSGDPVVEFIANSPGGSQPSKKPYNPSNDSRPPSEAQIKRLYAIGRQKGLTDQDVRVNLKDKYGVGSPTGLSRGQYDEFCKAMESGAITAPKKDILRGDDVPFA